jgi:hypothetical protein
MKIRKTQVCILVLGRIACTCRATRGYKRTRFNSMKLETGGLVLKNWRLIEYKCLTKELLFYSNNIPHTTKKSKPIIYSRFNGNFKST